MFVSDRRWPQLGWPARGPCTTPTLWESNSSSINILWRSPSWCCCCSISSGSWFVLTLTVYIQLDNISGPCDWLNARYTRKCQCWIIDYWIERFHPFRSSLRNTNRKSQLAGAVERRADLESVVVGLPSLVWFLPLFFRLTQTLAHRL